MEVKYMGTGNSGNYFGTYGARANNDKKTRTHNNRKANHEHVVSWAEKKASELTPTQRGKFNTATVAYDESTGKYYYGRNAGIEKDGHPKNPILFGDANNPGLLPSASLNGYKLGNCAEVDAVNSALNAGAKLENLHLTTIHTTKNAMGKAKPACQNCTYSFRGKVKRNYTGWHKEE